MCATSDFFILTEVNAMPRTFHHLADLSQLDDLDILGFEIVSYGTDETGNLVFCLEGYGEHVDFILHAAEVSVSDVY